MKKTLLGAAAAIAVAAVAFSGSANAACYWNGYNWNCARRRSTTNPTPISTVTSRIMGIPSPTPTGPTRTGIRRVTRVPGSPGQRPRRLLIASERAARRRWRLSEDGMT